MLTPEERSERARAAGHAMWAKLQERLRAPDLDTAGQHLDAAELARRRLAVLKAQRAVADAQRVADEAAARLAEVSRE